MPAPRSLRDLERPFRERQINLRRNRVPQRRVTVPQAAQNAGTFRPGDLARRPRTATPAATSTPQRAGLLGRARQAAQNARANRAARRAARNRAKAQRLRGA